MKELTIEEKAKAYDEAIENMRKFRNALNNHEETDLWVSRKDIVTDIEYYFPELKESEDERIRKEILGLVQYTKGRRIGYEPRIHQDEMVAWLEKQGQVKESVISQYENKTCKENSNSLTGEDEQKTSDKVEPKFHEGDKIHCKLDDRIFVIKEVDLKNGVYIYTENGRGNDIDYADEMFELVEQKSTDNKVDSKFHVGDWITNSIETVQFAGYDVDYGYLVDYEGNLLHRDTDIIEKEYRLWNINDAKDGDVLVDIYNNIGIFQKCEGIYWQSCLYLECNGELLGFSDGGCHKQTKTHPATKEQSDALKKAMTDAGYTFDFKKKELKKIEQKPAWSKEDEQIILSIEQVMNCASLLNIVPEKIEKIRSWLKSLKGRVGCEANCTTTWKSSDEQIKVCKEVYADILSAKGFDIRTVNSELNRLEEQLKKL